MADKNYSSNINAHSCKIKNLKKETTLLNQYVDPIKNLDQKLSTHDDVVFNNITTNNSNSTTVNTSTVNSNNIIINNNATINNLTITGTLSNLENGRVYKLIELEDIIQNSVNLFNVLYPDNPLPSLDRTFEETLELMKDLESNNGQFEDKLANLFGITQADALNIINNPPLPLIELLTFLGINATVLDNGKLKQDFFSTLFNAFKSSMESELGIDIPNLSDIQWKKDGVPDSYIEVIQQFTRTNDHVMVEGVANIVSGPIFMIMVFFMCTIGFLIGNPAVNIVVMMFLIYGGKDLVDYVAAVKNFFIDPENNPPPGIPKNPQIIDVFFEPPFPIDVNKTYLDTAELKNLINAGVIGHGVMGKRISNLNISTDWIGTILSKLTDLGIFNIQDEDVDITFVRNSVNDTIGFTNTSVQTVLSGTNTAINGLNTVVLSNLETQLNTTINGINGINSDIKDIINNSINDILGTIKSTLNDIIDTINDIITPVNVLIPDPDDKIPTLDNISLSITDLSYTALSNVNISDMPTIPPVDTIPTLTSADIPDKITIPLETIVGVPLNFIKRYVSFFNGIFNPSRNLFNDNNKGVIVRLEPREDDISKFDPNRVGIAAFPSLLEHLISQYKMLSGLEFSKMGDIAVSVYFSTIASKSIHFTYSYVKQ